MQSDRIAVLGGGVHLGNKAWNFAPKCIEYFPISYSTRQAFCDCSSWVEIARIEMFLQPCIMGHCFVGNLWKSRRRGYRRAEFICSFIFSLRNKCRHINSNAALGTRTGVHATSSAFADRTLKRVDCARCSEYVCGVSSEWRSLAN